MNEHPKTQNADMSDPSSPRRSPLVLPRSSRSVAEKRALIVKMQQNRMIQQKKAMSHKTEVTDSGDTTAAEDDERMSKDSDTKKHETISNQNIFILKQPQWTDSNVLRARSEEEFSEVFTASQMKNVDDLTKRVLDQSLVCREKQSAVDRADSDMGGADSFDRESAFMNDSPGDVMFDSADGFARDIANSPGDNVDGLIETFADADISGERGVAVADDVVETENTHLDASVDLFKNCKLNDEKVPTYSLSSASTLTEQHLSKEMKDDEKELSSEVDVQQYEPDGYDQSSTIEDGAMELSNRSLKSSTSASDLPGGPKSSQINPKLMRRHKMAVRVASGKVNLPKPFLSAAATSANKVADLENVERITVANGDTKESPTNMSKHSAGRFHANQVAEGFSVELTAASHTAVDVLNDGAVKPNITAITTEQSVELHASLSEFSTKDMEPLPTSTPASPLDSTPESQIGALNASISSDECLEKNVARRQRRHLRKRDVSIVKSSDEVKSSKDLFGVASDGICFGSVDEVEARKLFPMPSLDDKAMMISVGDQEPSIQQEYAWDARAASNLDIFLEQSKFRNTSCRDGEPLLELNAPISDAGENDVPVMAAEKLMYQKDRMTMYNGVNGFGLGDDSSVELQEGSEFENEVDENDPNDYQTVDDDFDDADAEQDTFDFTEFGKGSHEEFSPARSAHTMDGVLDQNGDSISDIDKRSDYFSDCKSSTTGCGTVLGLRFIGSNDESMRSRPSIHATQRIINEEFIPQSQASNEESASKKLFKIKPPPPEKIQKWEESWRGSSAVNPPMNREVSTPKQPTHPLTPTNTPPSIDKVSSLKISTPKSPTKKKPHSITEELNLSNQTKMAEKFVRASVKAAKKFEEEYSHLEHDLQYGSQSKSPERKGKTADTSRSRFFCAGDTSISNEEDAIVTAVEPAQLVGGAFSPWKIPDRAEEDSTSSQITGMYDDESYARASVAVLDAIRDKSELGASILASDKDRKSAESFEVSLDCTKGCAKKELSDILLWLFSDVLPSNAFSAFDIDNTSSSVLARRVLAIVNDDASLNLICRHVTGIVISRHGNKVSGEKMNGFDSEIANVSSSGDLSSSTCESSQVSSVSSSVSESRSSFSDRATARILKRKKHMEPFAIPMNSIVGTKHGDPRPPGEMLAANFISFLQQISHLTGVPLPIDGNPFLQSVVNLTTKRRDSKQQRRTMQQLVFDSDDKIVAIFVFLKTACGSESKQLTSIVETLDEDENMKKAPQNPHLEWEKNLSGGAAEFEERLACGSQTLKRSNKRKSNAAAGIISQGKSSSQRKTNLNLIVPKTNPSPFEMAVWNDPSIMLSILSFLGNPVSVCVVKRLNVFCNRLVNENAHVLMRDAVRIGGMSKFVRPSFWLWVIMERCAAEDPIPVLPCRRGNEPSLSSSSYDNNQRNDFVTLKDSGAAGKWQHIIERDVLRSFGNMPPHKTGAKYRQDSIVRALVSFGKEEIMRNSRSYQAMDKLPEGSEARHFKLSSHLDRCTDGESDDISETPTDTVSDWGAISPVGSMISEEPSAATSDDVPAINNEVAESLEDKPKQPIKLASVQTSKSDVCDPVLSGNALTNEMKVDLQNKLRSILHALAAQHEGLGYCQGMDYVVAHLLRVLQDTILLRVIQGSITVPGDRNAAGIAGVNYDWKAMPAEQLRSKMNEINSETLIVDEVVFRVMDTLFTTYNLQHMYWPELRCLKTCCRVFESLIKQKLPVLADHFEHHDLNVGLFALGWFQTLFLYLPSMPSATVCHMWDIWLVERSFKIFFRVGTAILFLSQPTLLNHDLEGMMTYLNTFPDATLLRRDILIPCALQIKITNSMLVEIEKTVTNFGKFKKHAGIEQYSMY